MSIVHKGLKRLWEKDDGSRLPFEQVDKVRRILMALDKAKILDPLRARAVGYINYLEI